MKLVTVKHFLVISAAAGLIVTTLSAQAPAPGRGAAQSPTPAGAGGTPAPGVGQGGGRGGGLPGATPEQIQAVTDMNTALAPLVGAAAAARTELGAAAFAGGKNSAAITAATEKLRTAELAVASARADAFAKLQAGPSKLNPEQVEALIASGGNAGGRGGRGRGAAF
jgi:uncharacterized membrane protein